MIKDIVVHLDGTQEDSVRLEQAARLCRMFGASLLGAYTNILPDLAIAGDAGLVGAQAVIDNQQAAVAEGEQKAQALRGHMDGLGIAYELVPLDVVPSQAGAALSELVRVADLLVATRPYGQRTMVGSDVLEAVLMDSGRGVLFVPESVAPAGEGFETVLIAWSQSRQATRAVAEAMPFLQRASRVIVVTLHEADETGLRGEAPGADLCAHLARHGIVAELHGHAAKGQTAETLISEAESLSADMIVMGGYGHSPLREWLFGGTTRDMLKAASVPMLLAH